MYQFLYNKAKMEFEDADLAYGMNLTSYGSKENLLEDLNNADGNLYVVCGRNLLSDGDAFGGDRVSKLLEPQIKTQ